MALAAGALGALLAGLPVRAAIIAHTAEPSPTAQRELANTVSGQLRVRVQNFRVTEPTAITQIEIHGGATLGLTDVNLFLLDAIGPGTGPANMLFSATQAIQSGVVGWWPFDLTGGGSAAPIVLDPGVYNVAITSPQAFGFGWSLVDRTGSENIQFRATSTVAVGEAWESSVFTFFLDPAEPVLGLRVSGEPAALIPAPGASIALTGVGLALLERRRRRS